MWLIMWYNIILSCCKLYQQCLYTVSNRDTFTASPCVTLQNMLKIKNICTGLLQPYVLLDVSVLMESENNWTRRHTAPNALIFVRGHALMRSRPFFSSSPANNKQRWFCSWKNAATHAFFLLFTFLFLFSFFFFALELSGDDSPKSFLSSFSCQQQTSQILPFKLQRFPPFFWLLWAAILSAPPGSASPEKKIKNKMHGLTCVRADWHVHLYGGTLTASLSFHLSNQDTVTASDICYMVTLLQRLYMFLSISIYLIETLLQRLVIIFLYGLTLTASVSIVFIVSIISNRDTLQRLKANIYHHSSLSTRLPARPARPPTTKNTSFCFLEPSNSHLFVPFFAFEDPGAQVLAKNRRRNAWLDLCPASYIMLLFSMIMVALRRSSASSTACRQRNDNKQHGFTLFKIQDFPPLLWRVSTGFFSSSHIFPLLPKAQKTNKVWCHLDLALVVAHASSISMPRWSYLRMSFAFSWRGSKQPTCFAILWDSYSVIINVKLIMIFSLSIWRHSYSVIVYAKFTMRFNR